MGGSKGKMNRGFEVEKIDFAEESSADRISYKIVMNERRIEPRPSAD
jgi:hypothetical protein